MRGRFNLSRKAEETGETGEPQGKVERQEPYNDKL